MTGKLAPELPISCPKGKKFLGHRNEIYYRQIGTINRSTEGKLHGKNLEEYYFVSVTIGCKPIFPDNKLILQSQQIMNIAE